MKDSSDNKEAEDESFIRECWAQFTSGTAIILLLLATGCQTVETQPKLKKPQVEFTAR